MSKFDMTILAAGAEPFAAASGFFQLPHDGGLKTLEAAGLWLGNRGALEEDERFRQIIPYVIVRQNGRILTYIRGASGGEARLHGKLSIGVGGHIDHHDVLYTSTGRIALAESVSEAAAREVAEEIGIQNQLGGYGVKKLSRMIAWKGLLIDHSDAVGRVHVGIVGIIDLPETDVVSAREDSQESLDFFTVDELRSEADRLESWTRLALPALEDKMNVDG